MKKQMLGLSVMVLGLALPRAAKAEVTAGFDFFVDASQDTDGDQYWEDLTAGNPTGHDLLLDSSPAVTRVAVTGSSTRFTHAYAFPGGSINNEAGALLVDRGTSTQQSFSESSDGDWSTQDLTLEIWVKPDNLTPTPSNGQIIFEDGGGTGLGILIDNNELVVTHDGGVNQIRYNLATDPSAVLTAAATSEFFQIVVTHDTASPYQTVLYINGQQIGTSNNNGDWSGGDAAGFGTRGDNNVGGLGNGQMGTETLDGQIALIRAYRAQILSPSEVQANYDELSGPDSPISFSGLSASNITATSASPYATASTNMTSVTLVWDTSDKGDTNLPVWTGSSSLGARNAGEVTGNATNLTADTQYFFRFYGEDASTSTNGWSSVATFETSLTAAQTPAFTSKDSSWISVTLEWQDNADTETGYVLRRSDSGSGGPYTVVATLGANVTMYEDEGVLSGTTHYYQLAATNDVNGSGTAFSACVTSVTTAELPPIKGELGIWKPWANGGINPATSLPWAAGDTYRLVFVSSTTVRDATATNMAPYHAAITTFANNAGLGGNWFVIGMTDGTTGQDNTQTTGTGVGIFQTDGATKVADSYTDFWDGGLDNPMSRDETGALQGSLSPAVGGFANGTPEASGGRHLGGSTEDPPKIHYGRSTDTGGYWARVYNGAASAQWRFYGMSDVLTLESTIPQVRGTVLQVR